MDLRHDGLATRPNDRLAATPDGDGDILVSLVVSTRNRARFLKPFLLSLGDIVSHRAWEIVIVDNGSIDQTWALLTRFAADAPVGVTLLREPAPGLSHARNAGVRAAAGRIVCFTDDDCYPRPDFIDAMAEVFRDRDLGFMGGQILLHDPADAPVGITTRTADILFPAGQFIAPGEIQGACMAFRREVFADVGLFHTAFGAGAPLRGAEDSEMVARAGYAGWKGGFFIGPVVHHHHRRRAKAADRITASYDYSAGALFAKLILSYPSHRADVVKHWYWLTPVLWRPSWRAFGKFWCEMRGAGHYALTFARSAHALHA